MALEIHYSPEFKKDYKKLPALLRESVKTRGRLFEQNPFYPLLHTHKLHVPDVWSFSVDARYRVLFKFLGDGKVVLLRVGDHSIYRGV